MSALESSAAPTQARGPGDIYRVLFSTPFGPLAVDHFQLRTAAEPEPVFGISVEDAERMGVLLEQLGNSGRSDSRRLARLAFGMAAGEAVAAGQAWNTNRTASIAFISGAALIAGIGVLQLVVKTRSEALAEEFLARRAALQTDPGQLIADIELKLIDINDAG